MESLLPPDPYKALGLPRDADIATIKKTYKKLALSCHPDKVTDESLKPQKQEEFHKINQAYELLSNESRRQRYDDEYRLEQLHKDKLSRGGAKMADPTMRSARYEVRTQAPAGATFSTPTAHRYEEHKPSHTYDHRYYEERPRKPDSYDSYAKPSSSSRSSREKEIPIKITRVYTDRPRSDKKPRDKEERRDRERRYESAEDESDEKSRFQDGYRRRSEEADARTKAESARRKADEQRRSYEEKSDRRSYEDKVDRSRKLSDLENSAVRYIHRTKVEAAERPSPSRSSSSRDARPEYYDSRSRREREAPRRSSARPKEHTSSSGHDRDRKNIKIVDWEEDVKIPSFKHSSSSPPDLHVPHVPQRSYTESSRDHRRKEPSPTPKFRRADTMPTVSHSTRRPEVTVQRPSGLRESATARDPGADGPETYPTIPPPSSSKTKYYYQTPSGGVRLTDDAGVTNGHRTVLHEPARHRTRSPSPLSRPPMGANRPVDPSTTYSTAVPKVTPIPPPLGRVPTVHVEPERGRRLYGEVPSDKLKRENARRQTSFSPDKVSYSQKIGPEHISWAAPTAQTSRMDQDRDYVKPGLPRHATYAY